MSAILAYLISDPTILAILAGIVGALGFGLQQRLAGAKAERNKQKAKESDSYVQELDDLASANIARNRVSGGLPDHDKYRRD